MSEICVTRISDKNNDFNEYHDALIELVIYMLIRIT